MNNTLIIKNVLRWIVLIFVQVFLLKNMAFYNLATPFVYVLFILLLPFNISNLLLYTFSFTTGLILDSFYDTLGVHATACVVMAFVRISFINLSLNKDSNDEPIPSLSHMGFLWFSLYSIITIIFHHLTLFFLEAFKFSEIGYTLFRTLLSCIFTYILILLIEFIFYKRTAR